MGFDISIEEKIARWHETNTPSGDPVGPVFERMIEDIAKILLPSSCGVAQIATWGYYQSCKSHRHRIDCICCGFICIYCILQISVCFLKKYIQLTFSVSFKVNLTFDMMFL